MFSFERQPKGERVIGSGASDNRRPQRIIRREPPSAAHRPAAVDHCSCARYRKVTTWARVQFLFGLKAVAEVPLVMPLEMAQSMAS